MAELQVEELGAFLTGVLPGILSLLGNATIQVSVLACLLNLARMCRPTGSGLWIGRQPLPR